MKHLWLCLVLGIVTANSNLNTSEKKEEKEDELLLVQVVGPFLETNYRKSTIKCKIIMVIR